MRGIPVTIPSGNKTDRLIPARSLNKLMSTGSANPHLQLARSTQGTMYIAKPAGRSIKEQRRECSVISPGSVRGCSRPIDPTGRRRGDIYKPPQNSPSNQYKPGIPPSPHRSASSFLHRHPLLRSAHANPAVGCARRRQQSAASVPPPAQASQPVVHEAAGRPWYRSTVKSRIAAVDR